MAKRRRVIWSSRALRNLTNICEYIALDDARAAKRFARNVNSWVRSLEDQPDMGRWVPEYEDDPEIREKIFKAQRGYRIIYRHKETEVHILGVYGPGQQLPETLE